VVINLLNNFPNSWLKNLIIRFTHSDPSIIETSGMFSAQNFSNVPTAKIQYRDIAQSLLPLFFLISSKRIPEARTVVEMPFLARAAPHSRFLCGSVH